MAVSHDPKDKINLAGRRANCQCPAALARLLMLGTVGVGPNPRGRPAFVSRTRDSAPVARGDDGSRNDTRVEAGDRQPESDRLRSMHPALGFHSGLAVLEHLVYRPVETPRRRPASPDARPLTRRHQPFPFALFAYFAVSHPPFPTRQPGELNLASIYEMGRITFSDASC